MISRDLVRMEHQADNSMPRRPMRVLKDSGPSFDGEDLDASPPAALEIPLKGRKRTRAQAISPDSTSAKVADVRIVPLKKLKLESTEMAGGVRRKTSIDPFITISAHREVVEATKKQADARLNSVLAEVKGKLVAAHAASHETMESLESEVRRDMTDLKRKVGARQHSLIKLQRGTTKKASNRTLSTERTVNEALHKLRRLLSEIKHHIGTENEALVDE